MPAALESCLFFSLWQTFKIFNERDKNACKTRCEYFADPPEIELETDRVHSGENKEAHLTCIIHGNPEPTVSSILI